MNTLLKTLLLTTAPALAAASAPAAPMTPPATTQPAPAAQPIIAQSNVPLVIPDGTSLQNPGPRDITIDRFGRSYDQPNTLIPVGANPPAMLISGVRQ